VRITPDTNVMISSSFWAGDSDRVMQMAEKHKAELVLSEEIIAELVEVLESDEVKRKIKDKNLKLRRTVEKIISISQIITPQEKINAVKGDPSDNKFLECAVAGKAEYIISKDKHLLKLKSYKGINIVKPEEFLKKFKTGRLQSQQLKHQESRPE